MAFKVFDPHSNLTINYRKKIEPIKIGNKFYPNYDEFNATSFLMLTEDFKKYQERGETILINFAGGWCTLTSNMKIVEEEKVN